MKVSAMLKGMIDSNGHQPIQIRIYHDGKSSYKPTRIKVNPELFKSGRVTKDHPSHRELNKKIELLIIQYQAQALTGFEKKTPKTNLYEYIHATMRHLTRSDDTFRQYNSQINKLKRFQPVIYLHDLNHDFFNRYKSWLIKEGNSGNTIWSAFKFLKTFVRKALDDKLLKEDPFKKYELPKYEQSHRVYLTPEEIKEFEKFTLGKVSPAIREAGLWALISCYSGLRISDIKAFDKKKNIIGGRLVIKTQKTGEIVGIPVEGKLKKYFELVDYKTMTMHNNTYNKLLKVIAAGAGIEKNLHPHLMRHTAAMLLANSGVSIEVTSKILGHSSLKHTSVYYKISNARIDAELKKRK